MTLRSYQQELSNKIDDAFSSGARNVLAVLPTGGGKCLGHGTPVLRFDGTVVPVEMVRQGDLLMGADSNPRCVVSTCSGRDLLYQIIPTKGNSYVVNKDHILSLRRTSETKNPKYPCHQRAGEIVNISVADYINQTKWFKHVHKGWRTGVDWQSQSPLPVDPYFLGVWLGDGTSGRMQVTTGDQEIIDFLATQGTLSFHQRHLRHVTIGIKKRISDFRKLNLIKNKHIPHVYKTASRHDRLRLLAGIIDTDGHLHHNGYDVVFKNQKLANDVAFVAQSLGFAAHVKECWKECTNGSTIGKYYRFLISGDVSQIPVILNRKRATFRKQIKNVLNTGITVKPVGMGDYFGFEIDGPDRLFLLGDFTVTHNSVVTAHRTKLAGGTTVTIAHRQELVYQLSLALARDGTHHRILAPDTVCNHIINKQIERTGHCFISPYATHTVASVDTLLSRCDSLGQWFAQVRLWQLDEAAHVVGGDSPNKWGRALKLFPNAKGIGWTATPQRSDRKPLRSSFDTMVLGPTPAELLASGHLCAYRVFGPTPSIDMTGVDITASGEFSPAETRKRAHQSTVTGDLVAHYLRFTPGAVGIAFLVDVNQARETAERFQAAGVRAVWMSARETDDRIRVRNLEALERGELQIICNVDLLGEGVDVPRVEVILDGAPTQSLSRYLQRFGRLLRTFAEKRQGTYLDAVGNVLRHGLPDYPHAWSLDAAPKRRRAENDEEALKMCIGRELPNGEMSGCFQPYFRYLSTCPHCGEPEVVRVRGAATRPEQVDGDLTCYGPELLAKLRGDAEKIMGPAPRGGVPAYIERNWNERAVAQNQLRQSLDWWGGWARDKLSLDESSAYRLFYARFGIDVATAATLGKTQATELNAKIWEDINNGRSRPKQWDDDSDEVNQQVGRRRGVKPTFAKGAWQVSPRINGKKFKYSFGKDQMRAQRAANWCNENPDQELPKELRGNGLRKGIKPHFHNGSWRISSRINGKQITYSFNKDQERAQRAANWCNEHPNQELPEEYR